MFKPLIAAVGMAVALSAASLSGQSPSPSQPLQKLDPGTITAGLSGPELERVTKAITTYNSDQCQGLFESLRMPNQLIRASRTSLEKCKAAVRVLKEAQATRAHGEQPD